MAQFLPLILLAGVMYVALILPQQRRTKEHRSLLSNLEDGDEIVLNSGIHGFITQLDTDVVWMEVAPGVELKVSRSAIATKIRVTEDDEPAADKSGKGKDKADKTKIEPGNIDPAKIDTVEPADKDKAEG